MRIADFYKIMQENLGFTYSETETLRRAEMTLHRWHELECGDGNDYGTSWSIERDETTGKPYMVTHYRDGKTSRRSYPDKEKGALRRISEVLKRKDGLSFYQQGDPRGCALYILRPGDVPDGEDVNAFYSRGIAVCY
jgi:hypothetical protein